MVVMPDNDVNHYLCARCNAIWPSRAVIDRTRPVRCLPCSTATPAWWDDELLAARLNGMTA
jgi:ribosomal protein L40E